MSEEKETRDEALSEEKKTDPEKKEEKVYRYPWQIFFIVLCEACERFSFYGMNAILTLYLISLFTRTMDKVEAGDLATELFHLFKFLAYFFPLFGAAMADSVLGKFRTIFYLSLVYAVGQIILSFGSITDGGIQGMNNWNGALSSIGILLIAIGTGGIKPCVVALGADQFKVPEQRAQMATYFAMFYASINFGSLLSTIITPYLRQVPCLGEESCFPLAFGVPAVLMIISLIIFLFGKPLYKVNIPERNIILDSIKCIMLAIKNRKMRGKGEHWLSAADPVYGAKFTSELKAVFRVGVLFLCYPMYWALYDQQGSRWTIQATNMNGLTFGFLILPDQMQVANPILILLLIPVFDRLVYPLFGKFGILKTPLQKIVSGCAMVALSFVVSGILELQIRDSYPVRPEEGMARLTVLNGLDTNIAWEGTQHFDSQDLKANEFVTGNISPGETNFTYIWKNQNFYQTLTLVEKETQSCILRTKADGSPQMFLSSNFDANEKSNDALPLVRFITDASHLKSNCTVRAVGEEETIEFTFDSTTINDTRAFKVEEVEEKSISAKCESGDSILEITKYTFEMGGSYNVFIYDKKMSVVTVTPANNVHIFWLLPQYIIITVGEILFSITSLEFSYSQAPTSMKAVMQSLFYLTTAFGNLIALIVVAIVSAIDLEQYIEFFLFAGMMLLFTLILAFLATRYEYVDYTEGKMFDESRDDDSDSKESGGTDESKND